MADTHGASESPDQGAPRSGRARALTVDCPFCHAVAEHRCRKWDGAFTRALAPHIERRVMADEGGAR
jgi:hypothetical protein